MPGPVSDSFDCEWGTSANKEEIADALDAVYAKISKAIGNPKPLFILDLLRVEDAGMGIQFEAAMSVREWRILRFALERAKESLGGLRNWLAVSAFASCRRGSLKSSCTANNRARGE